MCPARLGLHAGRRLLLRDGGSSLLLRGERRPLMDGRLLRSPLQCWRRLRLWLQLRHCDRYHRPRLNVSRHRKGEPAAVVSDAHLLPWLDIQWQSNHELAWRTRCRRRQRGRQREGH